MLFAACGFGGDAAGNDAGAAADGEVPPGQGDGTPDGSSSDTGAGDASVSTGPFLTAMSLPMMPDVDLEAEGMLGWIHWKFSMPPGPSTLITDVKASAPTAIPTFSLVTGNDLAGFADYASTFHWTNGMPEPTSPPMPDKGGVYLKNPLPPSFHLTVPANAQKRRLIVYCGLFSASAQFTAALGGLRAEPAPFGVDNNKNGYIRYAIDFASSAPITLDITWALLTRVNNNNNANITLSAATLAPSPP